MEIAEVERLERIHVRILKHMQGLFLQLRCIQLANLFTAFLLGEIVEMGCILQDSEENLCEQIFNNWKKPNTTEFIQLHEVQIGIAETGSKSLAHTG